MTSSWIYLFSKFTPEALLFEALMICVLCASYAALWVLRKRKYGVIQDEVPASIAKEYLNQLIFDAEQLRNQLFGLLADRRPNPEAAAAAASRLAVGIPQISTAPDPAFLQKMGALESKLSEQTRAMETIVIEKTKIEKDLQIALKKTQTAAAGSTNNNADLEALREKIRLLEAKLAEYSVIEDDLANLKRLQQENAQLKSALNAKGGALPEAGAQDTSAAATAEAVPQVEPAPEEQQPIETEAIESAPIEEPASETAPEEQEAVSAQEPGPAEMPELPPEQAIETAAPEQPQAEVDPGFENLVDQVEQSLQEPGPGLEPPAGASVAPAAAEAAEALASTGADANKAALDEMSPPPAGDKSDSDLVAEFEKMLNG